MNSYILVGVTAPSYSEALRKLNTAIEEKKTEHSAPNAIPYSLSVAHHSGNTSFTSATVLLALNHGLVNPQASSEALPGPPPPAAKKAAKKAVKKAASRKKPR